MASSTKRKTADSMWREAENGSLSHSADALAEDNKRLQEMLHSALSREAEALKRVKHLSELLSEYRAANSGTPSSGPELAQMFSPGGESWEGGDSDMMSGHSQCSENLSPSFVISPPLIMGSDEGDAHSRLRATRRNSLSSPNLPLENGLPAELSPVKPKLSEHTSVLATSAPAMSLPANLLAPILSTSGDVRKEREKPPPLIHRQTSPEHVMSENLNSVHKQLGSSETRPSAAAKTETPSAVSTMAKSGSQHRRRSEENSTSHSKMRARASSILRPSWLRKRRSFTVSHRSKRPSSSSSSSSSISGMFTQFLQHSSHIRPHPLAKYIGRPWSDVTSRGGCGPEVAKYRNAMWELFQSEAKYLCYQLLPLEQVYKAFLEELHFYSILHVADMEKIFANLSELVELSASVAKDLFLLFDGRSGDMIAPNNELILAFSMFGHKWNPAYQRFCVNMEKQRGFVKALHQLPDFQEYIQVCRGHKMVQRSDLTDLLITPMQHQCHYKLLLENVLKATTDPSEKSLLTSAIKAFVVALKELEANITAQHRSEELLELQETLSWPPLSSLSPDSYIPECLPLEHQTCLDHLATPERQILCSGPLHLLDAKARPSTDLYVFLLTDMILLTEPKTKSSKRDLTRYSVYQHPLFLHTLHVHNLPFSLTHKHTLTLVERNSVQQQVSIYSLQASSSEEKDKWASHIQQAQEKYWHTRNADTVPL